MQAVLASTVGCYRRIVMTLMVIAAQALLACAPEDATEDPCGNRAHEDGEECDDGNHRSGDGCSADCAAEEGFRCDDDGCTTVCGDGKISARKNAKTGIRSSAMAAFGAPLSRVGAARRTNVQSIVRRRKDRSGE